MSVFPNIIKKIPEGKCGIAEVRHFEVSRSASMFAALKHDYIIPGKYAGLEVSGRLVMSDTQMERRSNIHAVSRAHGKVLIAGLGLGMILYPILEKQEVEHVTVIEKQQDVIDLIGPYHQSTRLSIICADILLWKPEKGQKFNTIYFDIWPDKRTDNLEDMAKLHQRFKNYLDRSDPRVWMNSWCREELKARKRQEARYAVPRW